MQQFETPILFLVFNRPDKTAVTFEQIGKIKPLNLFVAADGYRPDKEGEKLKCETVRDIVKKIDWECNSKFLFRDINLGCSRAVTSAIDWFFANVNSGIIIEDDCLPELSFFQYCEELLKLYKNEQKIMMISGSNLQVESGNDSYYFSRYGQIWGWATWRRAWEKYEKTIRNESGVIRYNSKREEKFWQNNFKNVIWDVQWAVYSVWKNNGLAVLPNSNLITNIGFGTDATNYIDENNKAAGLKSRSLTFPLKHPDKIEANPGVDSKIFRKFYYTSSAVILIKAIKNKVIKLFRK